LSFLVVLICWGITGRFPRPEKERREIVGGIPGGFVRGDQLILQLEAPRNGIQSIGVKGGGGGDEEGSLKFLYDTGRKMSSSAGTKGGMC